MIDPTLTVEGTEAGGYDVRTDSDLRPSMLVPVGVAAVLGRDPLELPPLAASVPADALDTLLCRSRREPPPVVEFRYAGTEVTLLALDHLSVRLD
jgi:hypothetical protein